MKFKSFLITPFLLGTLPAANAIPFNEKKWGIITNLKITPLPTNKEEN